MDEPRQPGAEGTALQAGAVGGCDDQALHSIWRVSAKRLLVPVGWVAHLHFIAPEAARFKRKGAGRPTSRLRTRVPSLSLLSLLGLLPGRPHPP